MSRISRQEPGNSSTTFTALALPNEIALYDKNAALVATLPYHRDVDRWGSLALGLNEKGDRFLLWYEPSAWIEDKIKKNMPSYGEEMNASGQILNTYTLPPLSNPPRPRTWDGFVSQRLRTPAFFFGMMLYRQIGAKLGSERLRRDLENEFGRGRALTREISLYAAGLSLLLSAGTLFWARRAFFPWGRAFAWAGFVLAFNLAGFITFRLAADWPRLVACPRCGKRRPIETEGCPHCGSGWPAPAESGTEILARPAAEAPAPVA